MQSTFKQVEGIGPINSSTMKLIQISWLEFSELLCFIEHLFIEFSIRMRLTLAIRNGNIRQELLLACLDEPNKEDRIFKLSGTVSQKGVEPTPSEDLNELHVTLWTVCLNPMTRCTITMRACTRFTGIRCFNGREDGESSVLLRYQHLRKN